MEVLPMYSYEKEHIQTLRELAPECTVLLKKDGSFPLKEPGKVALYGNGARRTLKGGTGSGDVNTRHFISVEEGLQNAGFTITTNSWMDEYDKIRDKAHEKFVSDIKERAKEAGLPAIIFGMGAVMPEPEYSLPMDGEGDTAVYVLARVCGEGSDRQDVKGDFRLTDTEIRDILQADAKYSNFMLVLNVGGIVDLSPVKEVKNILLLSQPGMTVGDTLADIILGKAVPSGKLAATWASADDYPKIGSFGDRDDTRYNEGIYVGYRYFDTVHKEPVFPFGFGLSYTTFSTSTPEVSQKGTKFYVTTRVTNTGDFSGKEVVQLYASVPEGKLDQPYQQLAAFKKTRLLAPGESEELELSVDFHSLSSYLNETAEEILEPGDYIFRIGTDSRNTEPCFAVRLSGTVKLRQLRHVGGTPDFQDWKPESRKTLENLPADLVVFFVNSSDFPPEEFVDYRQTNDYIDPKARELAGAMTDEELRYLCVGEFKDTGSKSVIGAAAFEVPGAAGESTSNFKDRGIPNLVMADGPAGLRLSRQYGEDEQGKYSIGDAIPAAFQDFMDDAMKKLLGITKDPSAGRKGVVHEQYCTAIPVGTALAQTWNPDLVEQMGSLVGSEMEHFHVQVWLAPGMNIQRNPLCGRNFEYYSEDPLISGKMAAAMTRGVQTHPGCAVSVKHFCCNNQETNRFHTNSLVSERALRNIYLKGFQIAVKESQPFTVMSSYNLLNGVHTSERRDLNEDVLRAEWGFHGTVISDWLTQGYAPGVVNKYGYAFAGPSIAAGNDLMMPGSPLDIDSLKTTDRQSLERSAARVITLAWKLKGDPNAN